MPIRIPIPTPIPIPIPIHRHKWNKIQICMNKWRWMIAKCVWHNDAWSILEISILRQPRRIQTKEERNSAREREVERSETGEFNIVEGVTWWATRRRSEGRLYTNVPVMMHSVTYSVIPGCQKFEGIAWLAIFYVPSSFFNIFGLLKYWNISLNNTWK